MVLNRLRSFFSNPLVGILGSIASIAGLVLAIYFYYSTRSIPELTFFVHPVKATLVKTGEASRLQVHFEEKEIRSDITAAQVAIWNAGNRSIKSDNILQPIMIKTAGGSAILGAEIRKTTRDVIGMRLDTARLGNGEVVVSWKILEQNDGGIVQLIYEGSPSTDLVAEGVVEGQKAISQLGYSQKLKSIEEQYRSKSRSNFIIGVVLVVPGLGLLVLVIFGYFIGIEQGIFSTLLQLGQAIFYVALGVYSIFVSIVPGPPFPF
jgi:hypothetical protein